MLPKAIEIIEVGPREGYQFEGIGNPDKISTAEKIRLIEALSHTGVKTIQVTSFVHPKQVPQMADAEKVVAGISPRNDVRYEAVFLNDVGLKRAVATGKLHITGKVTLCASEAFALRNQKRTLQQDYDMQRSIAELLKANGIPLTSGSIMAAFGCNYQGEVPFAVVEQMAGQLVDLAQEFGSRLEVLSLADTMGWANPEQIRLYVNAIRERWPQLRIRLHLHDTRGLGIANVYAGLLEGVDSFDTAIAGLGGCPFAGHKGAAGNVCTEEVVFLCEQLGVETDLNLDSLLRCAELAQDIVQHPVPSKVVTSGGLLSRSAASAA